MNEALPELELIGGEYDPAADLPRFDPGGILRGVVQLRPSRHTGVVRAIQVVARWYTSGRGSVDRGAGPAITILNGPVPLEAGCRVAFEYRLPHHPWSYAGRLVSLHWECEVRLDVAHAPDRTGAAGFVLAPPPPGALRAPYSGPATSKREGD